MNKTLFNTLLMTTMISSGVSAAVIVPTADQIKELFQPMSLANLAVEAPQIEVQSEKDNFLVIVPAVQLKDIGQHKGGIVPEQKITLTRQGDFANHAQYAMTSNDLEYMRQVFQALSPDITVSAQSFINQNDIVPGLQLITKQSMNIKELSATIPAALDLKVNSLVADGLLRALSDQKMDIASSIDGTGVELTTAQFSLFLPHISAMFSGKNADIQSDDWAQIASADSIQGSLELPQMSVLSALLPFSVTTDGKISISSQDDTTLTVQMNHFTFPSNAPFINSPLTPKDVFLQIVVKGATRAQLLDLYQADVSGAADTLAKRDELFKTMTFEIPEAALVMAEGAIRLKGQLKPYALEDQWSMTADLTMTIVNMDKLSPVPTVNEVQCKQAEELAKTNPEKGELLKQLSCTPQGGILDFLRPFMTEKRTVDEEGNTLDTFAVQITTDTVSINGQPLSDMAAGMVMTEGL